MFQNPKEAYLCLSDKYFLGMAAIKYTADPYLYWQNGIATAYTMWIYTSMNWIDRSHEEYAVDLQDDKT